jgi:hypothetical protein
MKKILVFAALMIAVISFQCIRPGDQIITGAQADTTDLNPNGSSELARLMREMQKYTNEAKATIQTGKTPAAFPTAFEKIHTAKISEGTSKSDFYTQFADLYLMSVKNYATSNSSNRIETYNNMVNACLACHSQHCPGPVPMIKKMKM